MNIMKTTSVITTRALGLAIAIALGGVSAPAFAQEMDHSKMQMPAPEPAPAARKPEPQLSTAPTAAPKPAVDPHAGHVMPAPNSKPKPTSRPAPAQATPVDHAAMGHDMPPTEAMDHSAMGHDMPPDEPTEEMDHSAMGHDMENMTAEEHAGMQGQDLPANAAPREPIPAVTDSDRAAAFPDVAGHTVHDDGVHWFALLNRLETWDADEGNAIGWEGSGWAGTDLDRVWVRSEGESIDGSIESADVEVLYGRAIARWWDLVAGVRHDFGEGPSQTFAAVGVMGLAPYMFEVEATAYLGESGQTGLGLEAEYETLFTNRLIGQWLVEAEVWGQDDPERGIGSGLSTLEAGFRLRYEFHRQFAPYIGVVWERAYGGTADYRREQHDDIEDTRVVAGVRIWF
jgi:copper resistance protein B